MASTINNPYEQYLERFLECAAQGDVKDMTLVLKGTTDINARNNGGWTALMFAARNGHAPMITLLLENGSDIQIINSSGQTAADIARFWNHREALEALEPSDASPQASQFKHFKHVNFFGHGNLNRASDKRKDAAWIKDAMKRPTTQYILLSNLDAVVVPLPDFATKKSSQKYRLLTLKHRDISTLLEKEPLVVLLGIEAAKKGEEGEGGVWFAVDGSGVEDISKLHAHAETLPVYPGLMMLQDREAGIVGQARAVMAWHDRYQFCPTCGKKTTAGDAGYKRSCVDEACRSQKGVHNTSYPRVDPTAIMAVVSEDRKRLLLGRGGRFPKGMWSCLAGFIEPGETIEDACRREVEEESGVKVGAVEYHSCQPWPMPSSLMIGCLAFAVDETIKVDKDELEDAQWFTRSDVLLMLNRKHPRGLFVPPEQAIAHHLIRAWVSLTANL